MVAEMLDALIVQAQQQETDSQETVFWRELRVVKHRVPQARKSVNGYRTNDGRPNPLPRLTIKEKWLEQF